jgi:hypothetical protein
MHYLKAVLSAAEILWDFPITVLGKFIVGLYYISALFLEELFYCILWFLLW